MSRHLGRTWDCLDGQHAACATCDCGCHEPTAAQRQADAEWQRLLEGNVWTSAERERFTIAARHATQPRWLARLMMNPAVQVRLAAAGGVLLGLALSLVAVLVAVAL